MEFYGYLPPANNRKFSDKRGILRSLSGKNHAFARFFASNWTKSDKLLGSSGCLSGTFVLPGLRVFFS